MISIEKHSTPYLLIAAWRGLLDLKRTERAFLTWSLHLYFNSCCVIPGAPLCQIWCNLKLRG